MIRLTQSCMNSCAHPPSRPLTRCETTKFGVSVDSNSRPNVAPAFLLLCGAGVLRLGSHGQVSSETVPLPNQPRLTSFGWLLACFATLGGPLAATRCPDTNHGFSALRRLISPLPKVLSELGWRECCRTLWCPRQLCQNCRLRRALERFAWPALRMGPGAPCRRLVWSLADRTPDRRDSSSPPAVQWFADHSSWCAGRWLRAQQGVVCRPQPILGHRQNRFPLC